MVFALGFFLMIAVHFAGRKLDFPFEERSRHIANTIIVIFIWLIVTMIAAMSGKLANFSVLPPPIFLFITPALITAVVLTLFKKTGTFLKAIGPFWLVYIQSFRVLMEFILWELYRYNVIPKQMTFEGRNFDILIGLSAPLVAFMCFNSKKWSPKVALVWNFVGLAVLANIAIVALLSTPTPFRYFMNEPANTAIFYFPFVWLPTFVVPFAVLMHLLSIRQLLMRDAKPTS
jgi:hypothetical protein